MAYKQLISNLKQYIRENGNEEITGQIMQDALIAIVDALSTYQQFGGMAEDVTEPDTENNVFYFALKGTYPQFGGLEVGDFEIGIFISYEDPEELDEEGNPVIKWKDVGIPVPPGPKGDPGRGVPDGGTIGQVLAKQSDEDGDTEWVDPDNITVDHNITVDPYPTEDSTNPVQSGGVYEALQDKVDKVQLATTNDIATLGANGNLKDSGVSIGNVAMDANVVHKNGDETISGEKTFADKTIFSTEVKLIDGNEIGATFLSSEEGKIEFYGSPSEGTVQLKHITSPSVSSDAATKGYVDNEVATKYTLPASGIPKNDLASGVQDTLDEVGDIAGMIPAQASASNKLADKNFVNSSITTSTANFVGTYNSLAELQAVQNPTNNDYGFVIETDAEGNQYYDRYKYNGTSWLFEYKVESTSFTAAQWAAIQSGITAALVNRLGDIIPAGATAQNKLATAGDIEKIEVVDASTIPASMDADKVYQYGTLAGDTTFPALNASTDLTVAHVYCWTFTTPATAPTITWPSAITSWAGGSAPTINASKSYEVSVMDGFATIIEN